MATIRLNRRQAYHRLRQLLARLRGIPYQDVKSNMSLEDDLRINASNRRAISARINKSFADVAVETTRDETGRCISVRDMTDLVWDKIPDRHKNFS